MRRGLFCCVEKLLSTNIVFRLNPLSLEHSPYGFCNIQVRGVRRKIEQEESSLLPKWSSLLKTLGTMNAGIVQYKKCLFTYFEGEVFQKLHDFWVSIFSCVLNWKHSLSLFIMAKQFNRADRSERIQTCSPGNCHP